MLRVPLLIRVPGIQKKLSAAPFSLLHVAPTVLDAIGIESPEEFEGRSYWPEMQAGEGWHVAISEAVGKCTNPMEAEKRLGGRVLVLQDQRFKLVLDFERNAEELYDLKNDPQERNCLPKEGERKVRTQMLRMAHEHLARKQSDRVRTLRAIVREIGLEWSHSNRPAETLAT
jgi:arylsulfatase A-like enzyme